MVTSLYFKKNEKSGKQQINPPRTDEEMLELAKKRFVQLLYLVPKNKIELFEV